MHLSIQAQISILSNFAFCFVPIAVLGFVLMEKTKAVGTSTQSESGRIKCCGAGLEDVKHQLMISGCSARAYWVSMLVWDCCGQTGYMNV